MPTDLIWDVAVKTALVLALLYGALWFIRRYYGKTGVPQRGPSLMVVQSAALGPGRSVHLIGVGGKMLLVGATSQQVSLLAEVASADPTAEPEPLETADNFERHLRKAIDVAGSLPTRLRMRSFGKRSDIDGDLGEVE